VKAGTGSPVAQRRGRTTPFTLALPGAATLGLFFLVPLGAVWLDALADLGGFARVLANPTFLRSLSGSLLLTLFAAGFSLLVGTAVALHLARVRPGLRQALVLIIALPLTFSGLIVAYGFILAYGRAGFVTQVLAMVGVDPVAFSSVLFSPIGLGFASSYYLIPRVVMLMLPVLVNFDTRQIAAAESMGASRLRAYLDVMLPQLAPTMLTSFCLVAAVVFGAYGTALALVGTQVAILPLQLYSMIAESGSDFPAAAALSLILTAICSTFMAVGEIVAAGRETSHAAH